ncbi:MAG: hypothetical protein AB7S70_14295, partial [Hyphomicrobium sp.]
RPDVGFGGRIPARCGPVRCGTGAARVATAIDQATAETATVTLVSTMVAVKIMMGFGDLAFRWGLAEEVRRSPPSSPGDGTKAATRVWRQLFEP